MASFLVSIEQVIDNYATQDLIRKALLSFGVECTGVSVYTAPPAPDNYNADAASDARDTVQEFADEIVEKLIDDGEASDDLNNDYSRGDEYHHSSHVDKFYSLSDAAELLDQLSDHAADDSGLWEGQEPEQAIGTQAAYTYGYAVMSEWNDLIEEINDDWNEVVDELDEDATACEERRARLEALEDQDELTAAEQTELDGLKATEEHDSEEKVAERRKAKATEIVKAIYTTEE